MKTLNAIVNYLTAILLMANAVVGYFDEGFTCGVLACALMGLYHFQCTRKGDYWFEIIVIEKVTETK